MGAVAYPFTAAEIDRLVTTVSAGNYALGYINGNGKFAVRYVGRSDGNLNQRLKSHLGNHDDCTHFKFSYAGSPKAAFEKECQNFHDFGGVQKLKNVNHPAEPANSKLWKCPIANCTHNTQQTP